MKKMAGNALKRSDVMKKRLFDVVVSLILLCSTFWLIGLCWILAWIETGQNGFFFQERVGINGKIFRLIKIRTMKISDSTSIESHVTVSGDTRITKTGKYLRKFKLDELPQLFNVIFGTMSIVGPRPDVPGYADRLTGRDRSILTIRPGITGPASLAFRCEEEILKKSDCPIWYNDNVLYPMKVKINLEYLESYSFKSDLKYLALTLFPLFFDSKCFFSEQYEAGDPLSIRQIGNSNLSESEENKK